MSTTPSAGLSGIKVGSPKEQEQKVASVETKAVSEKRYNVFYHTSASCRMITETGRIISFVDHRYITDQEEEVEYLQLVMKSPRSCISTKEGAETMTSDELDPMKALKKKFIAEYLEEEAAKKAAVAATGGSKSSSVQQKLVPGSTADTADLAGDSSSTSSE